MNDAPVSHPRTRTLAQLKHTAIDLSNSQKFRIIGESTVPETDGELRPMRVPLPDARDHGATTAAAERVPCVLLRCDWS
jgi:hypothetical protein